MEIPGYRIREELTRDAQFVLCRAEARDGVPVLLKRPLSSSPDPAAVAALRRERELLRALAVEGVPRVRSIDGSGPFLVLEDIGAVLLRTHLGKRRLDLPEFFEIALDLSRTVGELHRRRVVHKNLCPESVLVEPNTRRTQVHDFALASRLPQETQPPSPPGLLPARLTYLSPEQTGRMNRVVDYRADLYSLGAVFYEMLTGRPPFDSDDPLELVHAHIAKAPPSPSRLVPAVPEALSEIVLKLLAKTAEGRYQSAFGLHADLELCARGWAAGETARFPLGERDVSEEFTIPQHLYGREEEIRILLEAFDRACGGRAALMLVGGYSGIGKTSLVNEVHKPIVARKGRFVSGKADQLERSTPYGPLLQAFRALVRQVLAEGEDLLATLRERLREALGANAGVVCAVIPELELLLGPQPAPPPLPPTESQNRFNYAFENFLGAFARPEHPLVVFLDDLQWADSATLQLLAQLLTNLGVRDLLLIGAFRDNEVAPGHPLVKVVGEIRAAGAVVQEIALGPLRPADLRQLVEDAVRLSPKEASPLADLVLRKTGGNPFFVTQFLKSLHRDALLRFDPAARGWGFDLQRIEEAQITDNVVDLMTRKLRGLALPTQETVTLAACIGNRFSLPELALVRERSLREVAEELWPAIEEGLVLPTTERYEPLTAAPEEVLARAAPAFKFLHDRVQQAAYALIPEDQRRPVHLRIGRLLLSGSGAPGAGDRLFEIANHLNIGQELIADEEERLRLVRLNLAAGRKAKEAAAFRAALDYFLAGLRLLPEDRWASRYELTLALTLEVAEGEYLCGHFEESERWFSVLLREARTPLEKAEGYRMRIMQCDSLARYAEAVRAGREGLALLGVLLPEGDAETERTLDRELEKIASLLGDRAIGSLESLPEMQDPEARMVVALATALWASAYILRNRVLASLLSAQMVRLSLERGNTADSAYGYATHAIAVGPVRGDYRSAYEWGALALRVNERLRDQKGRARVEQQFNAHVNLWRRPLETCIPHAREACRSGLETGDFTYAGYGAFTETWAAFFTCRDLDRFVRDYTPTVALLERIRRHSLAAAQGLFLNWARALQGRTRGRGSLSGGGFDEEEYVAAYGADVFCMSFYHAAKLHLGVTFEEHGAALEAARTARREAWTGEGTWWPVFVDFWSGLAMTALYDRAPEEERRVFEGELGRARQSLGVLALNCPENFRCFWLLLGAEMERAFGRPGEAVALHEEAIAYARQTGSLQHEALANELCARLWMSRGREAVASPYLDEAHRCYAEWGADGKAEDLVARYGRLLAVEAPAAGAERARVPAAGASEGAALDLSSVLKAAHAIAVEIELDDLLRKLIQIALENAGAEHAVFLLDREGRLVVEAEAFANPEKIRVRQGIPLEEAGGLARGVVHYVRRTGQEIVLGNAAADERFASDPYVAQTGAKSVLCVPVVHHGKQGGILYLENTLATEAFTAERTEMMRVLSGTAAISLENARLYEEMKREVARRTEAERAAREALSELQVLKNRLEAENVYLQEEIHREYNVVEMVGTSPALLEVLGQVERVAPTDATVLIFGETGTGKELFARAIHSRSPRRDRPLVKVNCGAIAPGLVESELFGHVKGAFTGALQARTGRFELADRGTVFLDEVSELPLETQVKLLRVLQEREFEPVGSSRTIRVDVRVIAASNRRLDEAVQAGRFRSDLLYRLNVFPLQVPPLRERAGDIPLLVAFFLGDLAKRLGKPLESVSRRSLERLASYSWPGNVRELQNVVERAAILATSPLVEVPMHLLAPTAPDLPASRTLEDLEREHILSVLKGTAGVIEGPRGAAGVLGMHPNTLRSRMKKLGIDRPRFGNA
jgi:predicted ATPase/transcriptional regulator with GAF, ATPase, and Fis domain